MAERRRPARAAPVRSWWGRAWLRTVEETTRDPGDLIDARSLFRSGLVTGVGVEPGHAVGLVHLAQDDWVTMAVRVETLDEVTWSAFAEVLRAETRHVADLASGLLTPALVEACDERGVELLPGAEHVGTDCSCGAWAQPCHHALALMLALARLVDDDPFALLCLRGRRRVEVLGVVEARAREAAGVWSPAALVPEPPGDGGAPTSLAPRPPREDPGAADRARRILELAQTAPGGSGLVDPVVASYDEDVAAVLAVTAVADRAAPAT